MVRRTLEISRRQALVLAGGGAAALLTPATLAHATGNDLRDGMRALAGKIFYTTDRPGRWKGKENSHSPMIKVDKKGGDVLVRAATQHGMSGTHYIIKHILLDGELNFVKEQIFDKTFDNPRSRFELNDYSGRLFVVSICNQHDNWINWSEV